MRQLLYLSAFLILGPSTLLADSLFVARPAGLRLVAAPHEGELSMRAFNHHPGSCLVFSLTSSEAGPYIVDIDFKQSVIESAFDNSGRNLVTYGTDDKREIQNRSEFWSADPKISSDGRAVLMQTSTFHPLGFRRKVQPELISRELSR